MISEDKCHLAKVESKALQTADYLCGARTIADHAGCALDYRPVEEHRYHMQVLNLLKYAVVKAERI